MRTRKWARERLFPGEGGTAGGAELTGGEMPMTGRPIGFRVNSPANIDLVDQTTAWPQSVKQPGCHDISLVCYEFSQELTFQTMNMYDIRSQNQYRFAYSHREQRRTHMTCWRY